MNKECNNFRIKHLDLPKGVHCGDQLCCWGKGAKKIKRKNKSRE